MQEVIAVLAATPAPTPAPVQENPYWWAQPLATIAGGLIVGCGALLGFKASTDARKSMEKAAQNTDERERFTAEQTHAREVMAARQDRYTTIAEQLASDYEPVRLAGVYALAALADEWQSVNNDEQRDVSIKLVCAYLRAHPRNGNDAEARAAAIAVIRDHTGGNSKMEWPSTIIHLYGAALQRANLSGANLQDSRFHGANLSQANLSKIDFSNASLSSANFMAARLEESVMRGAQLYESTLVEAHMNRIDLSGANASHADLAEAILKGANLENATLYAASLYKANLGTDIPYEEIRNPVPPSESKKVLVNFQGANLSRANLREAGLWMVDLRGADIAYADMSKARADRSTFSGMKVNSVNFFETFLNFCNFSQANIRQSNFRGAKLEKANFTGAQIKPYDDPWGLDEESPLTDMSDAYLAGAVFNGADLSGVIFGDPGKDEATFVARSIWAPDKLLRASWDEHTIWPNGFNIDEVIERQEKDPGEEPPPF